MDEEHASEIRKHGMSDLGQNSKLPKATQILATDTDDLDRGCDLVLDSLRVGMCYLNRGDKVRKMLL